MSSYVGRFAPSPTGPLHAGSLVAAMASYLDAKAHQGKWLVRIEDIDEARTVAGASENILHDLSALGMRHDEEVVWQSARKALYEAAFAKFGPHAYPCSCSRREIADSRVGIASDGAAVYPGTCRNGLANGKSARAWRARVPNADEANEKIVFEDRWMGRQSQHLSTEVGDFVLKRADGFWAYQLAVVVDDADQGVTHIVRGADLKDSTPRQIYLQRILGLPTPRYMHVPVVKAGDGEKLSKQNGASALDLANPIQELLRAANFLALNVCQAQTITQFWDEAIAAWSTRHAIHGAAS